MTASADTQHLMFDVVIVGAGMVGSAIACALAADSRGESLRIAVIEASGPLSHFTGTEFDPRVVALTHASQSLLDSVGAWDQIQSERLCAYQHMVVWDAEGTGEIDFHANDVQQANLGHIIENSVVARALMAQLENFSGITLLQPAKVQSIARDEHTQNSKVVLEDGRVLTAPLLLAADGANSIVRRLMNMPTREWNYGHHAIVTTVRTEKSHQATAWQRFLPSGPLAFLPLHTTIEGAPCDHYSSIVWSIDDHHVDNILQLDSAAFAEALSQAFEYRLGAVTEVADRYSFPLRQRHAVSYIQPGIALMGDAAHTIHPLAGQGVNLGFMDACAMRDEILRACHRGIPLHDSSILKRYQRARKTHNLSMMGVMEGFKRLFGADDLAVRWLRNAGMKGVNSVPLLKNALVKQAMGLR